MQYLENIIVGQTNAKNKLEVYKNSFSKSGRLPFLLIAGARGGGKTKLTREFHRTLNRPNGSTPPLIEVNAAAIKNTDQFFSTWYPMWRNNKAVLFIDEVHNLDAKLSELFLTILEKDPNPVRRIRVESREMGEQEFIFDFSEQSIVFATTDQQKLGGPLKDRLTQITLAEYDDEELYTIFKMNLRCAFDESLKDEIISVFRGHPRSCVELAETLDHYADGTSSFIFKKEWNDFRKIMGVHDYGFNEAELTIIKALGENRSCSLNQLAALTNFSRSVIQNDYEKHIMRKGMLDIDGKRRLTVKGNEFYVKTFIKR